MNKEQFLEKYARADIAVWCKTKELTIEFLGLCEEFDIKWYSGDNALSSSNYWCENHNIGFVLNEGLFITIDSVSYLVECVYTIIPFESEQKEENKMTNEERVKLVFETISKIVGFEIKPNKEFYIVRYSENFEYKEEFVYLIDEDLNLRYEKDDGSFGLSSYNYNTLSILKGDLQLEEIKEPLVTEEEKDFLRHFKFDTLKILTRMYMYDKNGFIVNSIMLENINYGFDGLKDVKKYSAK